MYSVKTRMSVLGLGLFRPDEYFTGERAWQSGALGAGSVLLLAHCPSLSYWLSSDHQFLWMNQNANVVCF